MPDADFTEEQEAELAILIAEMIPLLDTITRGRFRPKYEAIWHVALGWTRKVVRTVQAVMLLQSEGFAGEAQPLGRTVVEHTVALRWLRAQGEDIRPALKTNHMRQVTNFVDAWRASVESAGGDVGEQDVAELLASVKAAPHTTDNFQHFTTRVAHHGTLLDAAMYQAEMLSSHATFHSAQDYMRTVGDGDETKIEPLKEHYDAGDYHLFMASQLWIALDCYSDLFVAKPWRGQLARVRERLIAIDASIEPAL